MFALVSFLTFVLILTATSTSNLILQGSRVELECRPNSSSKVSAWEFLDFGLIQDTNKYSPSIGDNPNVTSSYVQKYDDGSVNLIFKSVQLSDAGNYTCVMTVNTEDGTAIRRQTTEINILAGGPHCVTYICDSVADVIEIKCSVNIRGSSDSLSWKSLQNINDSTIYSLWPSNGDKTRNGTIEIDDCNWIQSVRSCNRTHEIIHATTTKSVNYINTIALPPFYVKCKSTSSTQSPGSTSLSPQTVLIGAATFVAALVSIVLLVVSYRFCKSRQKPMEEDVDQGIANEYHEYPYAEIADLGDVGQGIGNKYYAEITDLDSQRLAGVKSSNLTRIERNGRIRLIGPDGTEYLEMNQVEGVENSGTQKNICSPSTTQSHALCVN